MLSQLTIFHKFVMNLKKTKSDIMRQLIPIVSCKEFEHMIPNVALEQLENYSKKSWEIFAYSWMCL